MSHYQQRFLYRHFCGAALSLLTLLCSSLVTVRAGDMLLTMPFENISGKAEYHWIGESFAVGISDLLDMPGMIVLRRGERNLAYQQLGLSANDILTRAAMLRVSETAQANLMLVGDYDIGGDASAVTIAVRAKLIETREGRLVGNKVFNFSGPLTDLQVMQGQLAWNILAERDPATSWTREKLVSRARRIPPRAFESFVKGVLTDDPKLRETFLRRSLQEYDADAGVDHYAQALFELGLLYHQQQNFAEAVKVLESIGPDDQRYLEAQFYYGLARWYTGYVNEAAAIYEKLVAPLPLSEVYNNAGALLTAKGDLLGATPVLQRGVEISPNDLLLRFNYGYALWKAGSYGQAIPHLKEVTRANNRDGEALYVLARCLAAAGKKIEADQVDQEARRHLGNYAKWEVEPDKIPPLIRLKPDFNRGAFYRLNRQQQHIPDVPRDSSAAIEQAMIRARQAFAANNENEALAEIQRVLTLDPTFARAHLLRGQILYKRNDLENAVNALSAAVYWNPRLVSAHVALGQIYLARGDRARALAHGRQASELAPQDREAIALLKQIENDR